MSLRAAGNRATNDAEAARQGLGRTIFWPVHDASLMIWSPNRACSLCHMSLDATKCNKMQHFWHFCGCCMVRHHTLEAGDAAAHVVSNSIEYAAPRMHHLPHRRASHSLPRLDANTTGCGSPTTLPQVMHQNAPKRTTFSIFLAIGHPVSTPAVALSLPRLPYMPLLHA